MTFFALLGAGYLSLVATRAAFRARARHRARDRHETDEYRCLLPGGTASTLRKETSRWADDQGPQIPPQQDRGP